jgi:effector-binding domain-containing protein
MPPSPPAPASPPEVAPPPPAATAPAVPAPPPETKAEPGVPGVPDDATAQMLQIPARPVAFLRGKSNWENGFKSIMKSMSTIEAEIAKAGLKQGGKPISVFVETDDNGFGYEAMIPLTEKPEGKDQLGSDVKIGSSPAGKAIKFQHRGSYDDIDATYDLITAYLDEKGLEAQNLFIEEYLTDTKNADDQGLQIDIYVFIK